MRAVLVCALVLAELLGGQGKDHVVKGATVQVPQKVITDDSPIAIPWHLPWYFKNQDDSKEDKSFIAEEDTKEGELWVSDDDPDFTLPEDHENQQDESYEDDDENYTDKYDDTSEDDDDDDDDDEYDYYDEYDDDYYGYYDESPEDQSPEDRSPEDQNPEDYNKKRDNTQQKGNDQGIQTFHEIIVPDPEGLVPYHSRKKRHQSRSLRSLIRKRSLQSPYQTSQVVHVPAGYEYDPFGSGVYVGVEPLLPSGGRPQHEVAEGVEPQYPDENRRDEGTSFGDIFRQGWRRFTDVVEDTVGHIGDKVEDVADKVHHTFHGFRERLAGLVDRFKVLVRKFGIMVQEGVHYCLRRLDHSLHQVQEYSVIEKLEKKLQEGHTEVVAFFKILGEKIRAWKEINMYENIDAGLLDGHNHQEQGQVDESQHSQNIEQNMPDFFQDPQVVVQLNRLADQGVLTENDIIILTEEHNDNNQQNQH